MEPNLTMTMEAKGVHVRNIFLIQQFPIKAEETYAAALK